MLSAPKLLKSFSTSGPSATAKPISAKIATISSVTWLTGWTRPSGEGRTGNVTSTRSAISWASSATLSSAALRAAIASATDCFSWL